MMMLRALERKKPNPLVYSQVIVTIIVAFWKAASIMENSEGLAWIATMPLN